MRLTVAVLVKENAARLARALESVRGLADELAVLDATGAAEVRETATAFGARRIESGEDDPLQVALRHCTTEWVLLMEADESIDPLDHRVLREALHLEEVQGFRLLRRSYLRSGATLALREPARRNESRYTEGRTFSHCTDASSLRLLRRLPELPDPGTDLDAWLARNGRRTVDLDAVVHHYGIADESLEDLRRRARFAHAAKEGRLHPEDAGRLEAWMESALLVGAWEAALEAAEARQRLPLPSPFAVRFGEGLALQHLGRHEEALARFEALGEEAAEHAPLLTARAESLWRSGRVSEAQDAFGAALASDPGFTLSYLGLADLFEAHGLWEDARLVLEAGLDQNPRDLRLWEALVDRAAARKDARAQRDAWNALRCVPDGGQGRWHQLLIHTLIANDRRPEALDILRRGLQAFPHHEDLLALKRRMGA